MRLLLLSVLLFAKNGWTLQLMRYHPGGDLVASRVRGMQRRLDAIRVDGFMPDEKNKVKEETEEVKRKSFAKPGKTKATPKKSRAKKSLEPSHWLDHGDDISVEYMSGKISAIRFRVRGNPRPLVRHRSSRGMIYNPSFHLQESLRNQVLKIMTSSNVTAPLFGEDDTLVMSLVLRMKRPKNQFVNGKRGPDRLKDTAPKAICKSRTDVDNLVKFVMDSMNKVLYDDDRQIASLHVTKILDNDGMCEGSTDICLRKITEDDLETFTENSFQIANG